MQVLSSQEGSVTVLKPLGPIVAGELEDLDGRLGALCRGWVKRVVLNMSHVTFVDSAGLELLDRYREEFERHGLKLKMVELNDLTRKIFDLTRLSGRFEMYPEMSGAIRSFL